MAQSDRPLDTAGQFFPADSGILGATMAKLCEAAATFAFEAPPRAIIVPHAGYTFCGAIAAAGWMSARGANWARIVVLSPSHHHAFQGAALPGWHSYATPIGPVPIDQSAAAELASRGAVQLDAAFEREHGIETQMPFVRYLFPDVPVVPLVIGEIEQDALQDMLSDVWADPQTLVVISTDLSHFQTAQKAAEIDADTAARIDRANHSDLVAQRACGWRPLSACLALARADGDRIMRLGMGDSTQGGAPASRVVGYGAWRIEAAGNAILPEALRGNALRLARGVLASRLKRGKAPVLAEETFPTPMHTQAACFVTLTRDDRLRGCIGSLAPRRAFLHDIAANTIAAALEDKRFHPLQLDELDKTKIKIALLSASKEMSFTDEESLVAQLRPGWDGLILSDGRHRGTFLPMVWDSLPDPSAFLAGLKVKAGLARDHWSDQLRIERFSAETMTEAPA